MDVIARCDRCGSLACCSHWRGAAKKWEQTAGEERARANTTERQLRGAVEDTRREIVRYLFDNGMAVAAAKVAAQFDVQTDPAASGGQ